MELFLKKVGVVTLCLMLLVGLFWNTLMATVIWTTALYQTKDLPISRLVPGDNLHLATSSAEYSFNQFDTIIVPHIFSETEVLNKDVSVLVFKEASSNSSYLLSNIALYTQTFQTAAGETVDEVCRVTAELWSAAPCAGNQEFVQVMMETSHKSASIFSTRDRKIYGGTFLTLKSLYALPETTSITPFTTDFISGYITFGPDRSVAYFFDANGIGYDMAFVKMTNEQILAVLSGIKPVTAVTQ